MYVADATNGVNGLYAFKLQRDRVQIIGGFGIPLLTGAAPAPITIIYFLGRVKRMDVCKHRRHKHYITHMAVGEWAN
jgi:hypothetical protein